MQGTRGLSVVFSIFKPLFDVSLVSRPGHRFLPPLGEVGEVGSTELRRNENLPGGRFTFTSVASDREMLPVGRFTFTSVSSLFGPQLDNRVIVLSEGRFGATSVPSLFEPQLDLRVIVLLFLGSMAAL